VTPTPALSKAKEPVMIESARDNIVAFPVSMPGHGFAVVALSSGESKQTCEIIDLARHREEKKNPMKDPTCTTDGCSNRNSNSISQEVETPGNRVSSAVRHPWLDALRLLGDRRGNLKS
jgi:hypothetical protein